MCFKRSLIFKIMGFYHHLWIYLLFHNLSVSFSFIHIYPLCSTLHYLGCLSSRLYFFFFLNVDISSILHSLPFSYLTHPSLILRLQLVSSLPDHSFLPSRVDEMDAKAG